MKVKDLIEYLKLYPPNLEVAILDGFNGGGVPREINLGPTNMTLRDETDLKTKIGKEIIVMGYGCY